MDWYSQTIKTYDESAHELAEYFKGIGARVADIELGLKLAQAPSGARVVEIGCGDGRDAEEIIKRVAWYEGFDPSEGLIKIAQLRLPDASFIKANAHTYAYANNFDAVFAFASLLHVSQDDMVEAIHKIARSLRAGGILFISLKERPAYDEEVKEDQYGKRMFYYYNPTIIESIAGESFNTVYEDHQKIGKTAWFSLVLQKNK
jgi:ubiquinone/menaquinone biosynthesis C-methylase UbiE